MNHRRSLWMLAALLMNTSAYALDENSYAQYEQVRVTDLRLDLDADFKAHTLSGFAELDLQWSDPQARELVLDSRDLIIDHVAVTDGSGHWRVARFTLGKRHAVKGQKLSIAAEKQPSRVRVYYRTSPTASGLQWLQPEQTQGKKLPFLFSQSESIHARSWVPIQDTPAVRFTFRAHVNAPSGMRVVMAADNDPAADGVGGYRFSMNQPIPSYLLAIAIGDLAYRPMGKRTGVYAEPGQVEAAAREFVDTEKMIDVAERLYGPYRWERYDLLVLPPSFPFGGMENPRLTFITPSLIAGDKSLVNVIAHELAHSWSGNLVTNASWKHFWLNEGFTTYVENRIVEDMFGTDLALMQQVVDLSDLNDDFKEFAAPDTWLVPELNGRDPDDVYSSVPYTKGAMLLRLIETRVGREAFDPFLRRWFDQHAMKSATTEEFLAFLQKELLAAHPDAVSKAEIDGWLYGPGLPKSAPLPVSTRFNAVDAKLHDWLAGRLDSAAIGGETLVTYEWLHFLDGLPADVGAARLADLDRVYRLSASGNSEILSRWFRAAIRADYRDPRPAMANYLIATGRRKLIVPVYEALASSEQGKAFALQVYAKARPGYHYLAQVTLDKKLGYSPI